MPRTGTLLTDEERASFGRWLESCIEQSGVPKSVIARRHLRDDSTQRLNRYCRGVIPTLPVLAKIVPCIEVSPPVALWRAGYFRELLYLVEQLSRIEEGRKGAVTLAVFAFPGPDVELTFGVEHGVIVLELNETVMAALGTDYSILKKVPFAKLVHGLHPLLGHAVDALGLQDVEPLTRRVVAAASVSAWAHLLDPEAAKSAHDALRSAADLVKALKAAAPDGATGARRPEEKR